MMGGKNQINETTTTNQTEPNQTEPNWIESRIKKKHQRQQQQIEGAKESVDRWEMCIVTTKEYFRLAMGALYSKNNGALKETRNGVSLFYSCLIAPHSHSPFPPSSSFHLTLSHSGYQFPVFASSQSSVYALCIAGLVNYWIFTHCLYMKWWMNKYSFMWCYIWFRILGSGIQTGILRFLCIFPHPPTAPFWGSSSILPNMMVIRSWRIAALKLIKFHAELLIHQLLQCLNQWNVMMVSIFTSGMVWLRFRYQLFMNRWRTA